VLEVFQISGFGKSHCFTVFFFLIILGTFIVQSFLGMPLVLAQSTCNEGPGSASVTLTPSPVPVLTHVSESQNIEGWGPDSWDTAWILICQQNGVAYT